MPRVITNFFKKLLAGKLSDPAKFKQVLATERADAMLSRPENTDDTFVTGLPATNPVQGLDRLKVGKDFFTQDQILRQMERANWAGCHKDIQYFAAKLCEELRRQGVAVYPHSAFRTAKEQNALKAKGRSKAEWPRAPHCQGKAVDIVHCRFHWDMTHDEWKRIGRIGKLIAEKYDIDIEWGGDWSFYDPAHWELKGWRDDIRTLPPTPSLHKTPRKILAEQKGRS